MKTIVEALKDLGTALRVDEQTRAAWDHEQEHAAHRFPRGAEKRREALHAERVRAGKALLIEPEASAALLFWRLWRERLTVTA